MENMLEAYIKSLTPQEKTAHDIAKNHLGSSFSLEKSIGFLKFKAKQEVK
jgi:hypothetical protein